MGSWNWGSQNGTEAPIRWDTRVCSHSFSAMWGHGKKAAICKPSRELSPHLNHAGNLILALWPPELWDNIFLSFRLPSFWNVVMAAEAKISSMFPFCFWECLGWEVARPQKRYLWCIKQRLDSTPKTRIIEEP